MRKIWIVAGVLGLVARAAHAQAEPEQRLVVFGDSISLETEQRKALGWPDELERLMSSKEGRSEQKLQVKNRAINGNGLIWRTSCFGEPALDRMRGEFALLGTNDTVVLMAGVNDLIQPRLPDDYSPCFAPAKLGAAQIIAALAGLRSELSRRDRPRVLLATIPPFGNSEFHSTAAEMDRQAVNGWIRANWPESDRIDLDLVLASDAERRILDPSLDSGDGLHPNSAGAARIAQAVAKLVR